MRLNKKGQIFNQLASMAIGIAVVAIVLVILFIVIAQGQAQIAAVEGITGPVSANISSVGINATKTIATAVDDIPGWFPLIIIVSIGGFLIMMVKTFAKNSI